MRRRLGSVRMALAVAVVLVTACGGDEGGSGPSNQPQVVACNTVSYQGVNHTSVGCAPGIASFTSTTTTGGRTVCFNITCSAGCVSSARVC